MKKYKLKNFIDDLKYNLEHHETGVCRILDEQIDYAHAMDKERNNVVSVAVKDVLTVKTHGKCFTITIQDAIV